MELEQTQSLITFTHHLSEMLLISLKLRSAWPDVKLSKQQKFEQFLLHGIEGSGCGVEYLRLWTSVAAVLVLKILLKVYVYVCNAAQLEHLTRELSLKSKFSGFRSRCAIFREWQCANASLICKRNSRHTEMFDVHSKAFLTVVASFIS